jgi:hypothetical protein
VSPYILHQTRNLEISAESIFSQRHVAVFPS